MRSREKSERRRCKARVANATRKEVRTLSFLARYLLRALEDDRPEGWTSALVSPVTRDFLGQLLAEVAKPALFERLAAWSRSYTPRRNRVTVGAWSPDGARVVATGTLLRIHQIAAHEHAVWLPASGKLIEASDGAWRWLRCVVVDDQGQRQSQPAETLGPLS